MILNFAPIHSKNFIYEREGEREKIERGKFVNKEKSSKIYVKVYAGRYIKMFFYFL
jgi:hypothetical protein